MTFTSLDSVIWRDSACHGIVSFSTRFLLVYCIKTGWKYPHFLVYFNGDKRKLILTMTQAILVINLSLFSYFETIQCQDIRHLIKKVK